MTLALGRFTPGTPANGTTPRALTRQSTKTSRWARSLASIEVRPRRVRVLALCQSPARLSLPSWGLAAPPRASNSGFHTGLARRSGGRGVMIRRVIAPDFHVCWCQSYSLLAAADAGAGGVNVDRGCEGWGGVKRSAGSGIVNCRGSPRHADARKT